MTTTHDTLIGTTLGKFRVDKLIGQGGMGAVYEATDTSLDRKVALKVIKPSLASGTEGRDFLRRFEREAKAAARFKHPNAIEIHALDKTPEGLLYMALEFIRGKELIQVLRDQGPLQPPQAVHVLTQVLNGLQAAHKVDIVHRDLKPHNIMIEDGPEMRAKILDFGIAKLRDQTGDQQITMAGQVMGTAYYMAPEQAMGKEVDHRTDLYAIGVILYQVLTGKLPYKAKEFMKVLEMHVRAPVPTIDVPGLEAFGPIVRRAMAKNPKDRFQSATEFANALQGALRTGQTTPPSHPGSHPGALAPTISSGSDAGHLPTGADISPVPGSNPTGNMADTSPMQGWQEGGTNRFFAALIGRTIGKYVIEDQLGEGGMGAVFRARDRLLGRPVALKVVHPSLAHRPDVRERFLREARATLEFSHPNAIATRGCDETPDGLLYMTLDYSPGETLRAMLKREERLETPRALGVARQALLAVAEAHGKGIVHRDLKPENMLIEQDERGQDLVRVCDFGLAKLMDVSIEENGESLTQAGQSLGTPHYMAPEQVEGGAIDGRADVYSMGCVLYELLTGTKPFNADSIRSIVFMHMGATPESLRQRAPHAGITPEVEAIVLKAMEKEPDHRFGSAAAFLNAIDALGLELPGTRPSTSRHGRVGPDTATIPPYTPNYTPGSGGPPGAVLVLGALVALALVGAVIVFGYRLTQQRGAQVAQGGDAKTVVYDATQTKTTAKTGAPTKTGAPAKTTPAKTDETPVRKTDDDPDAEAKRLAAAAKERERLAAAAKERAAEEKKRKAQAALEAKAREAKAAREERERIAAEKEKERLAKEAALLKADRDKNKDEAAKLRADLDRLKQEKAEAERKAAADAKRRADELAALKAAKAKAEADAAADAKRQAEEVERLKREKADAEAKAAAEAKRRAEQRLQADRYRRGVVRKDGRLEVAHQGHSLLFLRFPESNVKWISDEVSVGLFAVFAETLTGLQRKKAEVFLSRKARVMKPGTGTFLSRVPARLRAASLRGAPHELADACAKWLGCRLPSAYECRRLRGHWSKAKAFRASTGEAIAVRKGAVHRITEKFEELMPRIRVIGPPRLD